MEKSNPKRLPIILGALLLLAITTGIYFWLKSDQLGKENTELTTEVETLRSLRTDLLSDIESLQSDYEKLTVSNDSLSIIFKETSSVVEKQKNEISSIKKQSAKDAVGMKKEVDQLRGMKQELSGIIKQLTDEIASLRKSNAALAAKVAETIEHNLALELQVAELQGTNADLERDRKKLMATSTRATNLKVDVRKKGDKPTGSYRRAREIEVSFDVKNIAKGKEGVNNVYLVINDAKGLPVKVDNPVKATIKPDSGGTPEEIIAQQMMSTDLYENVRLKFKINPKPGTLKPGHYRLSIFTDWGLLGGAQFQLR